MPELLHGIIPIRIGFEISFPSLRDPWNAVNVVHCRHCESLAGVAGFHHCHFIASVGAKMELAETCTYIELLWLNATCLVIGSLLVTMSSTATSTTTSAAARCTRARGRCGL